MFRVNVANQRRNERTVRKEVMEKQDAQPPASDEQLASVAQDPRRYLTTRAFDEHSNKNKR